MESKRHLNFCFLSRMLNIFSYLLGISVFMGCYVLSLFSIGVFYFPGALRLLNVLG